VQARVPVVSLFSLAVALSACAAGRTRGGASATAPGAPVEVALTIDDLPRHGAQAIGKEPPAVAAALLSAFSRHGLRQVYGFVNAGREEQPTDREVLRAWIAAGHPLGNHTWAHVDLEKVPAAEFIADVGRNETTLAEMTSSLRAQAPLGWRVFRYPFLREGADAATREAVRAHLVAGGYRIAHVTIDPWDWSYNDAYVRCLASGAEADRAAVRTAFLDEARAKLGWSIAAAHTAAGRPVRHILLLHLGAIDADTIEDLLTAYESLGVRWITLDEAMADPIYAENLAGSPGGGFLSQLLRARRAAPPPLAFARLSVGTLCRTTAAALHPRAGR
jgi:peptidoglycan-N-acetylglucosamine deacetylase